MDRVLQKASRQTADQSQGIVSTRSDWQLRAPFFFLFGQNFIRIACFKSLRFVLLQGIYVLHDYAFRWFQHFSSATNAPEEAAIHTHFPCGLIRGMLSSLGIKAAVRAEVPALPKCAPRVICPLMLAAFHSSLFLNPVYLRMSSFYDTTPGSFTISVTNRANA
jgi:hypothetical protein